MRNYVIINGVNSLTIKGLAIKTLPPITKPIQRNLREEIDGRDGDIVTTLGYGAYDKTIEIGLFGTFDIDEVIAYFNQKGTITFSNEADKVYYFEALDQVDYAELLKFRTANVVLHCQPFKYPLTEEPIEVAYEYVEGTGENLTLDNTEETEFNKIDLLGNTEQTQYTGKNLANSEITELQTRNTTGTWNNGAYTLNGVNFTPTYKDGLLEYVNANGTASADTNFYFGRLTPASASTSYTINGCPSGGSSTTYRQWLDYIGGDYGSGAAGSPNVTTDLNIFIQIKNGYNAQNLRFKTMVRLTSITDNTYEPYVGGIPSPNPNYPQDIHVVSGDNVVEITGRNLFNEEWEDGQISSTTGENQTGTNVRRTKDYIIVQPNTTYTLSREEGTNTLPLRFYEKNKDFIGSATGLTTTGTANQFKVVFTTPNNCYFLRMVDWTNGSTKVQLEIGDVTNPTYEPYTGETYSLSLGDLEMASIPNTDYKDVFVKEGETWYKREAVGKVVFDGTESWTFTTNGNAWYISGWATPNNAKIPSDNSLKSESLSNYFVNVARNELVGVTNGIGIASSGAVNMKHQDYSSDANQATDFKAWLGTNKPSIYYILNTPTDTEITNETLIEQLEAIWNATSYRGQTNIIQGSNDLPFMMEVSALKLGSDHLEINNTGNIYSKPTIELEGTGIVDIYLNDVQVFEVDLSEENKITIDTEKMEAYTDTGLANRKVTGDYSTFKLNVGTNDLRFSGALTSATITNYKRWL